MPMNQALILLLAVLVDVVTSQVAAAQPSSNAAVPDSLPGVFAEHSLQTATTILEQAFPTGVTAFANRGAMPLQSGIAPTHPRLAVRGDRPHSRG